MGAKKQELPPLPDSLDDLGMRLEVQDPIKGGKLAKLFDREGNLVTQLPFAENTAPYSKINTLTPGNTSIPEEYRGKGLASDIYKRMEDLTGAKIVPDNAQTPEGFALHDKHGFGKKFGMSESDLMGRLTPEENMARNARKSVLSQIIQEAAQTPGADPEKIFSSGIKKLGTAPKTNLETLFFNAIDQASPGLNVNPVKLKSIAPSILSKVKSIAGAAPYVGTALGAGAALMSPDASAAIADAVVPGGVEGLGPSPSDAEIENPQRNQQLRQQALQKLLKR